MLAGRTVLGEVGFPNGCGTERRRAGRGPEAPSTPQEMVRKVDRAAPTHRTVGRLMMRAWAAAWESRDDSTVMGSSTPPHQTAPGAPLAGSTAAGSARVWRPLSSDVTASSAAAP